MVKSDNLRLFCSKWGKNGIIKSNRRRTDQINNSTALHTPIRKKRIIRIIFRNTMLFYHANAPVRLKGIMIFILTAIRILPAGRQGMSIIDFITWVYEKSYYCRVRKTGHWKIVCCQNSEEKFGYFPYNGDDALPLDMKILCSNEKKLLKICAIVFE